MDLTPRHKLDEVDELRRGLLSSRRLKVGLVTMALVVAAGFVLIQGLRNATLFFRNVDEAIEQREDLGDRRFRLQGRVIPASVTSDGGVTTFDVVFNCHVASVRHVTDPPELFESPWIPVVLEGHWSEGDVVNAGGADDYFFLSDRMLVKHTEEYTAENEARVSSEPPPKFFDDCPPQLAVSVAEGAA